jgi:hypothetical protein
MSMKNPMSPAGIEQATFQFVAQHRNNYATAVPKHYITTFCKLPENDIKQLINQNHTPTGTHADCT